MMLSCFGDSIHPLQTLKLNWCMSHPYIEALRGNRSLDPNALVFQGLRYLRRVEIYYYYYYYVLLPLVTGLFLLVLPLNQR
jgi:hypothetical protein